MRKIKRAQLGAFVRKATGNISRKAIAKSVPKVVPSKANVSYKPKATSFTEWERQNLPKNMSKLSSDAQNKIRSKNPFRNPEAKGPNRRPELAYSGGWNLDDATAGARDDFKSLVSERTRNTRSNPNKSANIKRQIRKDYKRGGNVKAKSGRMISKKVAPSRKKK